MIPKTAANYLRSIAQKKNHTLTTPPERLETVEGYRLLDAIFNASPDTPSTHTEGEYTTDRPGIAMAAIIAEAELQAEKYGTEAEYALRIDDMNIWKISGRLAQAERRDIATIHRAATMAKIYIPDTTDMITAMEDARNAGEINWPYVGMLNWEQAQS